LQKGEKQNVHRDIVYTNNTKYINMIL
jgi:hypothetical protein